MTNKVKMYTLSICIVFMMFTGMEAFGQTEGDRMMRRCGDGMIDIMIAPFDIVNHIEDVRYKEGMLPAMTYGTLKGMSGAMTRTMFGIYEMATFYVPEHNSFKYQPEFDSAVFRFE